MKKQKLKLFISDWDGTLFDSRVLNDGANAAVFNYFGLPAPPVQEVREGVTSDFMDFYHKHGIPLDITAERLRKLVWDPYVEVHWNEARPYRYAEYLLSRLKYHKIPVAIVTSSSPANILERIRELDFQKYIDEIRFDAFDRGRAIRELLQCFKVTTGDAIYMDDIASGIQAAQELGLRTIGVLHGMNSQELMQRARPDIFVLSLGQVVDLLETGGLS